MKLNFYILKELRHQKYVQAILPYSEIQRVSPLWMLDRGMIDINISDLPFKKQFGNILTDFISLSYSGLVSNIFVNRLKENSVTGWESVSVKFKLNKSKVLDNYNFLIIKGVVGPIDYKSGVEKEKIIDLKVRKSIYKYRQGVSFDISTWDGSDMFMSTDTSGYIFLTEKAKKVIEDIACPNLTIISIDQIEVDIATI